MVRRTLTASLQADMYKASYTAYEPLLIESFMRIGEKRRTVMAFNQTYTFVTWINRHQFSVRSLIPIPAYPETVSCASLANNTGTASTVAQCSGCRQIPFLRLRSYMYYIYLWTSVGWVSAGHAVNKNYSSVQLRTIEAWLVEHRTANSI